ncbi:hypothetical protein FRB94_002699 [Tulasnella sp. JGI-2019a]|nr:hypothetical protein FRB93_008907 [Tulasnella sp. JGI-2019a]KAG9004050.1 hypothetical protein FRB94_002699 [Tulasnella sp. JGI-2019a]KAG9033251.1 hypothetical protein FRB95_000430 [Tulasnella sp. JGI-2019a]
MDAMAQDLAGSLVKKLDGHSPSSRLLVGLAGYPASGKTTLANLLKLHINKLQPGSCIVVPLDGWHYTRAQLRTFHNAQEAMDRRGAEFTFDAETYLDFIKRLRASTIASSSPDSTERIFAPAFDHTLKDPTPDAICIARERIVIIEGLYVILGTERWRAASEMLDERWLIDVDVSQASTRIVKRHVLTGITKDADEATARSKNSDMPNGQFVLENSLPPTRRIISVEDAAVNTL